MWKKIGYVLYPFLIGTLLALLFNDSSRNSAVAGTIRKAELSAEKPLVVRLSPGRTTAISFAARPEKVVPGNPQALEINFLGKDLTIRPMGAQPGNLIVYTKSGRYVILLQMAAENSYDDVVSVSSGSSKAVRLLQDSFVLEQVRLESTTADLNRMITVELRSHGRGLRTQEPLAELKCNGCFVKSNANSIDLTCPKEIVVLQCFSKTRPFQLSRASR